VGGIDAELDEGAFNPDAVFDWHRRVAGFNEPGPTVLLGVNLDANAALLAVCESLGDCDQPGEEFVFVWWRAIPLEVERATAALD
jgi:hypothetical protein